MLLSCVYSVSIGVPSAIPPTIFGTNISYTMDLPALKSFNATTIDIFALCSITPKPEPQYYKHILMADHVSGILTACSNNGDVIVDAITGNPPYATVVNGYKDGVKVCECTLVDDMAGLLTIGNCVAETNLPKTKMTFTIDPIAQESLKGLSGMVGKMQFDCQDGNTSEFETPIVDITLENEYLNICKDQGGILRSADDKREATPEFYIEAVAYQGTMKIFVNGALKSSCQAGRNRPDYKMKFLSCSSPTTPDAMNQLITDTSSIF